MSFTKIFWLGTHLFVILWCAILPASAECQTMPGEVVENLPNDQVATQITPVGPRDFSLALGFGWQYGGGGINAGHMLREHWEAHLGVGFGGSDTAQFAVGVRWHPYDRDRNWRPRMSLNWGTVEGFEVESSAGSEIEIFRGPSIGIGFLKTFQSRKIGWELDVLYVLDNGGMDDRIRELENLGYSGSQISPLGNIAVNLGLRILI